MANNPNPTAHLNESPKETRTRSCDECGLEKPVQSFYKGKSTCRSCTQHLANAIPLADRIRAHRQEKLAKKLEREELAKIARRRLLVKRKAKREAAVKKLVPQVVDGEVEVEPAVKELAQRELSRRRLIEFIKEFHPRYKDGWVHHDICRRLEQFSRDVEAGKSPRLMILMPPRHGKSQIASKLFPAWHLGHNAHHEIIACSYNVSLALDFSREVRGVLRSNRYATLFPSTKLDPEFQGAEAWKTVSPTGVGSGGYVAAGIGGPINGKGAHVLIIDDPLKNAEEAESVERRQLIWNWYGSTAYTRLAPGGGVLIIQTWWHDDDLAGRLMAEMKGDPEADQFEIVKYPAVAEEDEAFRMKGEALHPDRYDLPALERIKRTLGGDRGRYWSALYQQNPVPAEGAFFTNDMFMYRTEALSLEHMIVYQAWDFAIGEKRYNDYTVGVTAAVDYDDNIHLLDVVRFRSADSAKIARSVLDTYQRYADVQIVGVEDGQIWRGFKPLLQRMMIERRIYPTFHEHRPLTDKQVRAQPLQGRMVLKRVTFPRSAEWLGPLRQEFLRFPAGMHDDIVDAVAWLVATTVLRAPPARPAPPRNNREETVAEKLKAMMLGGGKGRSGIGGMDA
jgi:predicted phage terminase large subunit-like protein